MTVPSKERLKIRSQLLAQWFQENYGIKVKHGHCLDLVSRIYGFKDWNTFSAALESKEVRQIRTPYPVGTKTVGELKEALSLYSDDAIIHVYDQYFVEPDFTPDGPIGPAGWREKTFQISVADDKHYDAATFELHEVADRWADENPVD